MQCLMGTGNFFGCGKDEHKVIDCPTIATRGKQGKQVPPSFTVDDAPRKRITSMNSGLGDQSWMMMIMLVKL